MVPLETAWKVADTLTPAKRLPNHGLSGFAGLGATEQRELVHNHGFVGGNAVVTAAMGDAASKEHAEVAKERLKNVAELELNLEAQEDAMHKLEIKVWNRRAGHDLPTSLTYVRQIWLDVTVLDEDGNVLLRSGALDDHNNIDPNATVFRAVAVDKDGKPTNYIWRIARFETRNTIPPLGYQKGEYSFNVPAGSKNVKVIAKLNYQSFPQYFANKLLGDGKVTVPTIEMEHVEKTFPAGQKKVALKQ
jgi:hypothetical protein